MSTQIESGIPLTLVAESDRKHFRLLELPPEILALLTSDDPPILELKSSGRQGDEDAGTTVLCTSSKTFNLRQKNSSNTVYLLQPHDSPEVINGPSLHAIAQLHSSLELTPFKPSDGTAIDHMKTTVPVYSSTGIASNSSLNKRALFEAISFSEQECAKSFRELAAFEHPETGCVFRPSAALIIRSWHDILTAATAQSVDLQQPMSQQVISSTTAAESEIESAIAQAVLHVFADHSANGLVIGEPDALVVWLGRTLLEAEAANAEVSSKVFLEKWKDLLPEKWRSLAEVSKLAAYSQTSDGGKSIMLRGSDAAGASKQTTNTAAGSKRKWHEKFRPTKK